MTLKTYLEILRPANCVMAAFGVFIGYAIASGGLAVNMQLVVAMAVVFTICGAGMAINDVFDALVDAKLKPQKPIPSKKITSRNALAYSLFLFQGANIVALLFLPVQSFIIALAFSILLIAYAAALPNFKYFGNWVVALGTAFTLVFGASLFGNYSTVFFFAGSALFANVAREIVKDIEDMKQDEGFKVSLPMIVGVRPAKYTALTSTALAIMFGFVPFFNGFGGAIFAVFLSIAAIAFVYAALLSYKSKFARSQKIYKIAMFVALVSFLSGVI